MLFAELGVGPGSRAYQDDEEYGLDEDKGLIMDSSATIAMCRPCASNFADLKIENPWFALREERAADDPGGSVFATPVSQLNISSGDVADDYVADGDMKEGPAAAIQRALLVAAPQTPRAVGSFEKRLEITYVKLKPLITYGF